MGGLSSTQKFILAAAGVGAAAVIGYSFVKGSTGARGGACSDPSSPCYAATQPYIQAYQSCANSYAYYQHQFDLENAANRTGLTQDQVNTLNYYQGCMDTQAAGLAKAAAQFVPTEGLQSLLVDIGEGIAVAAVAYAGLKGAPSIIGSLKTPAASGSAAASKMTSAIVQDEADSGAIAGADATAFISDMDSRALTFSAGNTALYDQLASEAVITAEESAAVESLVSDAIAEDTAATDSLLVGL